MGVVASGELVRCANPTCPSVKRGRPRVLVEVELAPGSRVTVPSCRACGWSTTVLVASSGAWEYRCSPERMEPRG